MLRIKSLEAINNTPIKFEISFSQIQTHNPFTWFRMDDAGKVYRDISDRVDRWYYITETGYPHKRFIEEEFENDN